MTLSITETPAVRNIHTKAWRYPNRTNKKCESIDASRRATNRGNAAIKRNGVNELPNDLIENARFGLACETPN
jgi:hypothetical protein